MSPPQPDSLWADSKFRWLIFSVGLVAVFEISSLLGYRLQPNLGLPFFAIIVLVIGWRTLLNGLKALVKVNFKSIYLLMTVAVVGAFYLGEFEEAAVVIVLFALGERLEEFGVEQSKSALQELVERTPKRATVKADSGELLAKEIEDVDVGEVLVIKPSDMIALDAEIIKGSSSIDESTITGEPIPRGKHPGDKIFAGTMNLQGYLEAKVLKTKKDTTLSKIIETTFAATQTKAETQKFIERFSSYYTPSIIVIAGLLVAVPTLIYGQAFDRWFSEAITLLVIACPCALVISTPISIYAAIGNASKRGALVKGGKYIEALGRLKALALDKTRTLTLGKPIVTNIIPFGETTREHLLACAAGIESYSEHPLATSIVQAANDEKVEMHEVKNFQAVVGKGVKADCVVCKDQHRCIGKLPFVTEEHTVQDFVVKKVEQLQKEGKTSIVVSSESEVEGIIALTDEIKKESVSAVANLKNLGVIPIMLTGDNTAPAQMVAKQLGIERVKAGMLPEEKADAIRDLLGEFGSVGMVGDGVNDAPALALSSVGLSMGAAGSDTAIEASSVAVLNDHLEVIPFLIALGRKTISTIKLNTGVAIATKVIFVLLAIFGLSNLALAILADVGVTIAVILNSLRLLNFRI
ncbi:MAG: cation-transporting P-type ATPase [Acidobacteria bacterium]|nr:MAG: cation-transporting P-type ATPase [Acidobacteriota bacterium]REJ98423.1 MAG: cation-transporting P-type ATPase [Acidobacteriota bacterium]REK17168.1 MAG: cation-transporting P-type ATPase [Acidobacteriota bacterium]REK43079.1 MAG: cation-transporting P-type ATPase [Acidobacteriota bacterium]